mgnify:CR=1 FL=1
MTISEYLDLVQAAVKSMAEFSDIGVVVDHQQDVESIQQQYLAKCSGYAVVIGEVSNRIAEKNMKGPMITLRFGVTIFSPKIIPDGEVTGAALRDLVLRRIHNSKLFESKLCTLKARYKDGKTFIETDENEERMIHATAFESDLIYEPHPDLES